jgi:hypothetical protein
MLDLNDIFTKGLATTVFVYVLLLGSALITGWLTQEPAASTRTRHAHA